ncbi:hypothetical protein [Amycolatopsis sp. EV170708-02-1]|uniref:hypothetical protein n=1 Tax=Amycolatopsis sp. EV170708-02-1 TaxID=2919322 RepID=UPI001F0CCA80|nr:hypothetical protein [Amycolatopsis sp. EV170708-02-1]UMP02977.1 hypothetical protein MJQ72_42720 [Amycolatopsis sp. EV170708-02-1]
MLKNFLKAFVVAGAAAATIVFPSVAVAQSSGDDVAVMDGSRGCDYDRPACVTLRNDFVRHGYKVSDIFYTPPDATCPGGCNYYGYWFRFWR